MSLEDTGQKRVVKFEEGWSQIKAKAIDVLENFLLNDCEGQSKIFNNNDFSAMYTLCYDMSTQRPPDNCSESLYRAHAETFANFLNKDVLPSLKAKQHSNEYFLRDLSRSWKNHEVMNKWMKKFFQYLDRFHSKFNGLPTLTDSANRIFKSIIYEAVKKDATTAVLAMIEQDRCGSVDVDRTLIKSTLDLYIAVGVNGTECYTPDFEVACLGATREFYKKEAAAWMKDDNLAQYLQKVEGSIEAESQRCKRYLHVDTESKLLCVLEEECLGNKLAFLFEDRPEGSEGCDCRSLFVNDSFADLHRMFTLLSRLPTNAALIRLSDLLSKHISDQGVALIEEQVQAQSQGSGADEKKESKEAAAAKDDPAFMQKIVALHDKYANVIKVHFNSNIQFQKAMKDAFSTCMNMSVGTVKFPDLLASYSDRLLKSGGKTTGASSSSAAAPTAAMTEQEIEVELESIVGLFTYVLDKDMFSEIYRNLLSNRLLHKKSASDEMEKVMVGKLKLKCGNNYTSKLEGMLNDHTFASDHQQDFKKHCATLEPNPLGKAEVTVTVLTQGHWPTFKAFEDVILPDVMLNYTKVFWSYYDKMNSGRRLMWVYSLGTVEMRSVFGGKNVFDIQLNTLQAVVLMLFNPKDGEDPKAVKTFEQIVESTRLPDEVVKRVMHSMACGKQRILRKIAAGSGAAAGGKPDGAASRSIKNTDSFAVNDTFTSPSRKFRIPMSSLDGTDSTAPVTKDQMSESRGIAVDSSIVRVMKIRKQLGHQQLMAEVLAQLSFFMPEPKFVKKRIESLIEREYLERDTEDPNLFKYLA